MSLRTDEVEDKMSPSQYNCNNMDPLIKVPGSKSVSDHVEKRELQDEAHVDVLDEEALDDDFEVLVQDTARNA